MKGQRHERGYDAIADKVFGGLQVDRFLLEYDDARSGTFEPLRLVPADKTVVLGLVSSQAARARNPNRACQADRRGDPICASRPPCAEHSVRLRVDGGGQLAFRG